MISEETISEKVNIEAFFGYRHLNVDHGYNSSRERYASME
jgi:hypothetical protein